MVHLDSGAVLQASAYGGDAISAYEILTETIEKRLRRYNRKLKQHRHHTNGSGADTAQSYVLQAPDDPMSWRTTIHPRVSRNHQESEADERRGSSDGTGPDSGRYRHFRHAGHGGFKCGLPPRDGNIGWIDPALRAN